MWIGTAVLSSRILTICHREISVLSAMSQKTISKYKEITTQLIKDHEMKKEHISFSQIIEESTLVSAKRV